MSANLLGKLRPIAAGAIVFGGAALASLTASGDGGSGNRFVSAMRLSSDDCKAYLTGDGACRQERRAPWPSTG